MRIKNSKIGLILAVVIIGGALFLYAGGHRWLPWFGGMARNHHGMHGELPANYARLINPITADSASTERGRNIYTQFCAACHGMTGRGDGPAGKALSPAPADLKFTLRMPVATDSFLFWSISEGGRQFNTAMPAFKEVIGESDRWHLINYLRSL